MKAHYIFKYLYQKQVKFIYLLLILFSFVNIPSYSQSLHAIIFAATDEENEIIRSGLYKSVSQMEEEFELIAKYTNLSLKKYYYTGSDFNKYKLESVINSLYCGSNDVIIFYYGGHGFRYDNQYSKWPVLAVGYDIDEEEEVKQNAVEFEWVINKLKSKGSKLTIAISESCNNEIGLFTPTTNEIKGLATLSIMTRNPQRYKELYLQSEGTVIISASDKEAHISGENGGYLTQAFIEVHKELTSISNGADWNTLCEKIKKRTQTLSEINDLSIQIPIVEVNITNFSGGVSNVAWDGFLNNNNYYQQQPNNFVYNSNYGTYNFVIAKIVFFNGNVYFLMSDNYIISVDIYGRMYCMGYRSIPLYPGNFIWDIRLPSPMGLGRWGVDPFGRIWTFDNLRGWYIVGIVYY